MNRPISVFVFVGLLAGLLVAAPPSPKRPKYAAGVTLLADDHEFVRREKAPDFWRLVGHYRCQPNDAACSSAVAAMVVNALRNSAKLEADDELATPENAVAKTGDASWSKGVAPGGDGIALEAFAAILPRCCAAFGVDGVSAEALPIERNTPEAREALHWVLVENERSAGDLVVVNLLQSALTGDPQGAVGHMAVIAAYDAKARRALILDPDRRWYEPYWVSLEALTAGMATLDEESGRSRGYIRVVKQSPK